MMNQARPVALASRVLGALSMLLGLVPILGDAFAWFSWSTNQINAYTLAVGTGIAAGSLVMGVRVERVVTPVDSPRDNSGNTLVPAYREPPI